MIIDYADGLHISVTNRAADEIEAALPQILAECVRRHCAHWDLFWRSPCILYRLTVHEAPKIGIETSERLLDLQERTCIAHGGLNFQAVTHDVGILHELRDALRIEARHTPRIELRKSMAITIAAL